MTLCITKVLFCIGSRSRRGRLVVTQWADEQCIGRILIAKIVGQKTHSTVDFVRDERTGKTLGKSSTCDRGKGRMDFAMAASRWRLNGNLKRNRWAIIFYEAITYATSRWWIWRFVFFFVIVITDIAPGRYGRGKGKCEYDNNRI